MNIFRTLGLLLVLCIGGMLLLRRLEPIAVDVASCQTNDIEAVVTVHDVNRQSTPADLNYDVALVKNTAMSKYGGTGMCYLKLQHIDHVHLEPKETKDEVVHIALPPKVRTVNAIIMNLSPWKASPRP